MRTLAIVAAAGLLVAGVSIPALADKPADPGAGGQAVKETVAAERELGVTFGSVVSEFVQTTDTTLGEEVKALNAPPPRP